MSGDATPGPRLPESVLRRRPAEVVVPRPRTGGAPPDRAAAPRLPQRRHPAAPARTAPGRRPVPPPRPVRGRRPVPIGLIAAALVFAGLFCVGMGIGNATGFTIAEWFRGPDKPPPRAFPVLDPSPPIRVTIPSLKVRAPILEVGLAADGSVDVPPVDRHSEAGWFKDGPSPGQFGPALIVGHADTRTGPSVFHDVPRMKPGQRIEVLRRDGVVAIFEVNSVENFGKTKLPVSRVYGDFSRPSLRLLTCGGRWLGGDRGYSDNVVVFASLVDSEDS